MTTPSNIIGPKIRLQTLTEGRKASMRAEVTIRMKIRRKRMKFENACMQFVKAFDSLRS